MAKSRCCMSQSNVVTIVLVGAALVLFLYTFSEHGQGRRELREPSRLPSPPRSASAVGPPHPEPADAASSSSRSQQSGLPLSAVSQPRLNARTADFFKQQAKERKSMFEAALASKNPTVPQVLLPIVAEAYCPSLVRVGSVGDGGKWLCNPWAMPKGGVVFSLGSHNDISFEADYQKATGQAATIITVDMNAASSSALAGLEAINAKFVHAMIAPKTNLTASPPHYTVADLMKKMGHDHIEMLKMDIEGAEYTVLPQFLSGNSVCQIMVEIHAIAQVPTLLRAVADAGFLLQKYELNAFWTGTGLCEYSYIHESCLEKYGATLLASYLKK
ncbi:hypothetical protein PRIPAC_77268 [Pristionchus pacificus]|uniref:Methyltranfer_dom domain-containing protein n=1 Tax=Pristionchus pacificus TaxID=54126 RepID=A0A2A6BVS8_PRIPA|nr:hypothetical protein PRIPAC_77268 [Pristionchus pacificus]|eukprot:PDM69985.1 hypothetical protein PRIPAC_49197 [Pristionchus pacificus]